MVSPGAPGATPAASVKEVYSPRETESQERASTEGWHSLYGKLHTKTPQTTPKLPPQQLSPILPVVSAPSR